jgi:hypothetical protein
MLHWEFRIIFCQGGTAKHSFQFVDHLNVMMLLAELAENLTFDIIIRRRKRVIRDKYGILT